MKEFTHCPQCHQPWESHPDYPGACVFCGHYLCLEFTEEDLKDFEENEPLPID